MGHEVRREELLYDSLARYGKTDYYPYHMPGHKRRGEIEGFTDFFQIDITEIDGLTTCIRRRESSAGRRSVRQSYMVRRRPFFW